jgi:sodium transport system ATP-binding protein
MAAGAIVASGTPAELMQQVGCATLEDAFVRVIGSEEGLN